MSLGRATRPLGGTSRMPRNGARTVFGGPGDSNAIRLLGEQRQRCSLTRQLKTRVRQTPDDQPWVWTGLCATHKLWLVLAVGPRTQLLAHAGMHQLHDCLLPGYVPLFFSECVASPCGMV